MERIYINRDCCLAYTTLALHSIYNSANKERTIDELIEEIKVMFKLYQDENQLMDLMKETLKKEGKNKIYINTGIDKIGMTIEECAETLGVSKQLVSKLTQETDFPCIKFRRRIVINKELLSEWFKKHCGDFYVDY